MSSQAWMVWPDNFAVSFLVLAVLAMAFMYAARAPMHGLLRSVGHTVGGPLRMGGMSEPAHGSGAPGRGETGSNDRVASTQPILRGKRSLASVRATIGRWTFGRQ